MFFDTFLENWEYWEGSVLPSSASSFPGTHYMHYYMHYAVNAGTVNAQLTVPQP